MSGGKDDIRIRPGRIKDRGPSGRKAQSFVGQVMRAARKAGHTGHGFTRRTASSGRSAFGRGRFASAVRGLSRSQRRVVVKALVVRHRGARFRSAPLAKHIAYLQREGVTRDGRDASLFGREGDDLDERAFAARCEEDRHHFRFIVSPEDAGQLEDLRAFTRDLLSQAERDLGTKLDWVGVDHWNTDNPHIHVLVRGRAEDGSDLVISRDYISRGLRGRAEQLVELELGPRTLREIAVALDAEMKAERWTGLDRALRALADEQGGVADLRPGSPEPQDAELRRRLIGRAQTLERLGLAERQAPAVWSLKPGLEQTLREMADRGDIIRTMHRALSGGPNRAQADFAIEATPVEPILGRLVERGLHDELSGEAYAVIDAVDGRVAFRLGHQPQLGAPLTALFGLPIYRPWQVFIWWYWYDAYAPRVFMEGAAIAGAGGIAAIAVAILLSVLRARGASDVTTYGSARWAGLKDITAAGLFADDGVVLGRLDQRYLRHDGPEHVLCFAPTRSGKGVGLVVPSLLTWPGSAIVHDIKGENWQLTAGWRSRFSRVLLFDPTNPGSAAYNPLLEVRRGDSEVRDVQNVADILVDPEGQLERRNHWEKTSHSLLVGAILHVLYAEVDKTLAGVAAFLSDPKRPIEATLTAMMRTPHLVDRPHPVVAQAARELLNKSENERSGVLSTAMSFLGLYRDPVVARVTRRCDWRIDDLVSGERPVSLYLVVPPSDISRTKPLVRLVLNQIGRRLTEELEAKGRRHRVLLMLDEFPALGRLDFFESQLAFMAGYGLKAFLIAQSLNQIEKAYGQNNAILDNCHVRVAFATNDERTAKRVSDALGTATEMRAMKNYAGHRLSPWLGHLMVSRQETARPLLTPGEMMQLPPTEEIVLVSGAPPVRAKKARYYEDRQFKARILAPPHVDSRTGDAGDSPQSDDWSSRPPIAAPTASRKARARNEEESECGVRREPALPEHEQIAPETPGPREEFAALDEEPDDDAQRARAMQGRFRSVARQAALDPDDGIEL